MAKLMKLTIDVQEEAFGRVLNAVNSMRGVGNVHVHLTKIAKQEGETSAGEGKGLHAQPVILAALGQGKPLSKREIEGLLMEAGIPIQANTVHGAIYQLRKKKLLVNGKWNAKKEKAYAITAAGKKSLSAASAKQE